MCVGSNLGPTGNFKQFNHSSFELERCVARSMTATGQSSYAELCKCGPQFSAYVSNADACGVETQEVRDTADEIQQFCGVATTCECLRPRGACCACRRVCQPRMLRVALRAALALVFAGVCRV